MNQIRSLLLLLNVGLLTFPAGDSSGGGMVGAVPVVRHPVVHALGGRPALHAHRAPSGRSLQRQGRPHTCRRSHAPGGPGTIQGCAGRPRRVRVPQGYRPLQGR